MSTLLTLNLNLHVDKHGAWDVRRPRIVDAIRRASPDVVVLQAVQQAGADDPAQALAEALGYDAWWFHPLGEGPLGAFGSAFVSRVAMRRDEVCMLSTGDEPDDPSPRAVLAATFALGVGEVRVFDYHGSWVPERARANFEEAQAFMARFHGPRILAGDLNAPADAELTSRIIPSCDWVDAWSVLRGDDDGATFESDAPSIRIDYFFVSRDLADRLAAIELVRGPSPAERLSDHLGLRLRLA